VVARSPLPQHRPRTSTDTVPAFTRNTNSDAPMIITASAARNAASTSGRDVSDATIVAARSRQPSDISATGSAPRTTATRKSPPTSGTATSSLNSESAISWTMMTGQLAAAMRAPRFSAYLRTSRNDLMLTGIRPLISDPRWHNCVGAGS
jgi:hypothetical protein